MNGVDGTPQKPLHILYVCESEPYLKNNITENIEFLQQTVENVNSGST